MTDQQDPPFPKHVTNTTEKIEVESLTASSKVSSNSIQEQLKPRKLSEVNESKSLSDTSISNIVDNKVIETVQVKKIGDSMNHFSSSVKHNEKEQQVEKVLPNNHMHIDMKDNFRTLESNSGAVSKDIPNNIFDTVIVTPDCITTNHNDAQNCGDDTRMLKPKSSPRRSRRLSLTLKQSPPSSPPTLSTHYKRIIVNVDNKVIDTINYDKIVTPPKLPIRRSRRLSLEPLKPLDVSIIKKKPKNKKKKRRKKNVIYHDPNKIAPALPILPPEKSILQRPAYSSLRRDQPPQKRPKHSRNVIFHRPKAAFYMKKSFSGEFKVMDQETVDIFFSIAPYDTAKDDQSIVAEEDKNMPVDEECAQNIPNNMDNESNVDILVTSNELKKESSNDPKNKVSLKESKEQSEVGERKSEDPQISNDINIDQIVSMEECKNADQGEFIESCRNKENDSSCEKENDLNLGTLNNTAQNHPTTPVQKRPKNASPNKDKHFLSKRSPNVEVARDANFHVVEFCN